MEQEKFVDGFKYEKDDAKTQIKKSFKTNMGQYIHYGRNSRNIYLWSEKEDHLCVFRGNHRIQPKYQKGNWQMKNDYLEEHGYEMLTYKEIQELE